MDYITVTAKTVQDAILEASLQLETFRDNIEYEVVEEGTSGFLGFGAKKAVIKARKKKAVEDVLKDEEKTEKSRRKEEKKEGKREKKEYKKERKAEEKQEKKAEKEKEADHVEAFEEETEEKAQRPERKVAQLTPEEAQEAMDKASKFMKDVFASIDMEVGVATNYTDEVLNVELSGDDMGILIGKRGQTLDSLQYLTSLVVNKGKSGYTRVKVDTENYRSRRKETLENLAKNIAFKVKRTRRPVFLEPMNPYERRIIHSALQNDPYVTTHSEGEEPYRKVVVTLKKNNR